MNTNVLPEDIPRFEKLAKPRERIDNTSNFNAFKVKQGALSYEITDRINKLAQPRRNPNHALSTQSEASSSKNTLENQTPRRLINSNQQLKDTPVSNRKKLLLDTYAGITATRNKRYPKRLLEFSRLKQDQLKMRPYRFPIYDNSFRTLKKFDPKPIGSTNYKRN